MELRYGAAASQPRHECRISAFTLTAAFTADSEYVFLQYD